ncbi:hypothetical protein GCM10010498_56910 [Streptomyces cavourensis]|nr:hypothetical protein GCM10010498_56910 [Streptomyces cavourensis]
MRQFTPYETQLTGLPPLPLEPRQRLGERPQLRPRPAPGQREVRGEAAVLLQRHPGPPARRVRALGQQPQRVEPARRPGPERPPAEAPRPVDAEAEGLGPVRGPPQPRLQLRPYVLVRHVPVERQRDVPVLGPRPAQVLRAGEGVEGRHRRTEFGNGGGRWQDGGEEALGGAAVDGARGGVPTALTAGVAAAHGRESGRGAPGAGGAGRALRPRTRERRPPLSEGKAPFA